MTPNSTSPSTVSFGDAITSLQRRIQGQVVVPGQSQYDELRVGWNLTVDQRPALIVVVESAGDISESVQFAREQGIGVAVLATGHGVTRLANDCLLINTSAMSDVLVDGQARTARIEAGAKWGPVLEKAQAFGLAPLLGSSPDVGAVGYTLGGGMGWLARKYGMSADSVNYFELVTADGQHLRASQSENSDLFWGLRGGGGSLGIITAMEIQLYPVSMVYGGNLVYPMPMAKDILTRYRDWLASVPEEMTSSIALMNLPPLPSIPEFLRGKSVVMVRGCYCGPIEEGQALIQSWRDWRAPVADLFHPMPFSEAASISSDPEDPVPGLSSGAWLSELSDGAIDVLVEFASGVDGPSPLLMTETRHAGGAIARVDPASAAYSHRNAAHTLQMVGMTPTPDAMHHFEHYTSRMKQELQPYLKDGVYMNFIEGKEARERVKDGFSPENYRRLTELKAKYDPDNIFRYSINILPREK